MHMSDHLSIHTLGCIKKDSLLDPITQPFLDQFFDMNHTELQKCKQLAPITQKSVNSSGSYATSKTSGQNWNEKWNGNGIEWDGMDRMG